MYDYDTFLSTLYYCADEFCKHHVVLPVHPGPEAALSVSEVLTLSVFGQWSHFTSETDFYRFAERHLRPLFPRLPARSQFNRQERQLRGVLEGFFLHLAQELGAQDSAYEVLDRVGIATRWCGRRGGEWLDGYANRGKCNRLGFFHGLHLLSAVSAEGILTGYGVGPASAKDQPMAETLFALRQHPDARFGSIGRPAGAQTYVLDKGFSGPHLHQRWRATYGVEILCAPQRRHGAPWPKRLRTWVASLRQIVESVHEKLLRCFRLERERPHSMSGFFARMAAKASLHNFCIWLNRQSGRTDLAFADLIDW